MQDSINTTRSIIKSQFDLSWSLLEIHLNGLNDEICLWKPCSRGLCVEKRSEIWHSDWPDSEGYGVGPSNIAWITWHIIFWWSMVFNHSFGDGTLKRENIYWPGTAVDVKREILSLRNDWIEKLNTLSDEEFISSEYTKWPFESKPFYELAAWLNLELMKNAAEIGYCRFLYASQK